MLDADLVGAGSGVVGDQGPLVLETELPVEQDRGGQREQSLADADNDPRPCLLYTSDAADE